MGLINKLMSKEQIKETQYMASTAIRVETPASFEAVMNALDSHVVTASDKSSFSFVNYITSRTDDRLMYACGNKLSLKVFEASVNLSKTGDKTVGIFKVIRYFHKDGVANRLDDMRDLRNQVKAAFESLDSARVSE